MAFGRYSDEPKKIRRDADFVTNRNVNAASNRKKKGRIASAVEDMLSFAACGDDDRFTVNVPSDAGGRGYDITVRVVSGTPSDGTTNEVQVKEGGDAEGTRNRMLGAFNGNSGTPTAVYKFGAGSGDYTTGIAGIIATAGTGVDDITITATNAGIRGNNIVFTDDGRNFMQNTTANLSDGTDDQIVPFSVNIRGPANLRGRTTAYKVTT